MAHLASLATEPAAAVPSCGTQEAHDLRNLLATLALHLETLQRLSGPNGAKAADAAHAIIERAAALCDVAMDRGAQSMRLRRQCVDLVHTARDAADLLASLAPEGFSFDIDPKASACVLADPNDAFRILFNLMHNAVAVAAKRRQKCLKSLVVRTEFERSMTTMKLADDGPGLPLDVRARLFGTQPRRLPSTRHGHGLAIAREFAERNGGMLTVETSHHGTTFILKLPSFYPGQWV